MNESQMARRWLGWAKTACLLLAFFVLQACAEEVKEKPSVEIDQQWEQRRERVVTLALNMPEMEYHLKWSPESPVFSEELMHVVRLNLELAQALTPDADLSLDIPDDPVHEARWTLVECLEESFELVEKARRSAPGAQSDEIERAARQADEQTQEILARLEEHMTARKVLGDEK